MNGSIEGAFLIVMLLLAAIGAMSWLVCRKPKSKNVLKAPLPDSRCSIQTFKRIITDPKQR